MSQDSIPPNASSNRSIGQIDPSPQPTPIEQELIERTNEFELEVLRFRRDKSAPMPRPVEDHERELMSESVIGQRQLSRIERSEKALQDCLVKRTNRKVESNQVSVKIESASPVQSPIASPELLGNDFSRSLPDQSNIEASTGRPNVFGDAPLSQSPRLERNRSSPQETSAAPATNRKAVRVEESESSALIDDSTHPRIQIDIRPNSPAHKERINDILKSLSRPLRPDLRYYLHEDTNRMPRPEDESYPRSGGKVVKSKTKDIDFWLCFSVFVRGDQCRHGENCIYRHGWFTEQEELYLAANCVTELAAFRKNWSRARAESSNDSIDFQKTKVWPDQHPPCHYETPFNANRSKSKSGYESRGRSRYDHRDRYHYN